MIDRRAVLVSLLSCAVSAPARADARTFDSGMVSLTYDDGLDSHLDIAVPALDARGLHGTFYVTWENIEERAEEWRRVAAKGHELANHTMTHPCDIGAADWRDYARRQIAPLNRKLSRWEPSWERQDFAYPCDVTDLGPGSPNRQLRRFAAMLRGEGIASARTSEGPPNSGRWVRRHPYRLQALAVGYDAHDLLQLLDYVHRAQGEGKWAILVFHEIVAANSGNGPANGQTATELHHALLDALVEARIPCRRVCDVMQTVAHGTELAAAARRQRSKV